MVVGDLIAAGSSVSLLLCISQIRISPVQLLDRRHCAPACWSVSLLHFPSSHFSLVSPLVFLLREAPKHSARRGDAVGWGIREHKLHTLDNRDSGSRQAGWLAGRPVYN